MPMENAGTFVVVVVVVFAADDDHDNGQCGAAMRGREMLYRPVDCVVVDTDDDDY